MSGAPDERDGRQILLTLTDEGRKLHTAVLVVAQERQERLLKSLPDGYSEVLFACLDRLQAEANAMLDETASRLD